MVWLREKAKAKAKGKVDEVEKWLGQVGDNPVIWVFFLFSVLLTWLVVFSLFVKVSFAEEPGIVALEYGSSFSVLIDPSPDERATGHRLYFKEVGGEEFVYAFPRDEVMLSFEAEEVKPGTEYVVTATAHDNSGNESVRSNALLLQIGERTLVPLKPIDPGEVIEITAPSVQINIKVDVK